MDKYMITDGARYISKQKNGQYVADDNKNKALVLPRNDAEKVLKNNLNKAFRKIFRLQKTENVEAIETSSEVDDVLISDELSSEYLPDEKSDVYPEEEYLTDLSDIMAAAEKYLTDITTTEQETFHLDAGDIAAEQPEPVTEEPKQNLKKKKKTKHYDTPIHQNESFLEDMRMVARYFKDADSRKKEIQDKLDRIEKEILDIRHYIEFKSLNACEGYNAYKMLRQRLIARRECKNELRIMDVLTASVFTTKDIAGIENIIDSFDTVVYKPRVLTDLFEEKEKSI